MAADCDYFGSTCRGERHFSIYQTKMRSRAAQACWWESVEHVLFFSFRDFYMRFNERILTIYLFKEVIIMRKEVEELMKECDELMDLTMGQLADMDAIECLDETSLDAMKKTIKIYKKSKELSIKMAEMIDEQDKKLDKIIKLLEAKK